MAFLLKKLLSAIVFLTALGIMLAIVQYALIPNRDRAAVMREFDALPKGSIQVIATGTSKIHANINPAIVWHAGGVTLFDASGSSMDLRTTYHYVNYCLRTNKPVVVMIDPLMMTEDNTQTSPVQKQNIADLSNLYDRYITALNVLSPPEIESWTLPVEQHHRRVYSADDGIGRLDFTPHKWNQLPHIFLGYRASKVVNEVTPTYEVPAVSDELYRQNYGYLKRIIVRALAVECKVVLINTPDARMRYMDDVMRKLSTDLSNDGLQVDFIAPSDYLEEIDLDYSVDFYDQLHMNISGGDKFSRWLAEHLAVTYPELKRKVDDSAWQHAYQRYQEYLDIP